MPRPRPGAGPGPGTSVSIPSLQNWKQHVRAGTTGPITLSGLQTVDGVVLVEGDRVLVKDQVAGAENGLYNAFAGAWSRTFDANANDEVRAGMSVVVAEGTINADQPFQLTTDDPISLGVTALVFTAFGGGGGGIGAAPLNQTTEAFSITVDPVSGVDPTVPVRIATQVQADAFGSFLTMAAAVDTLPEFMLHPVTLLLESGVFSIGTEGLGIHGRFSWGHNSLLDFATGAGQIIYKSKNGLVIEPSTSQMTVASASTDKVFDVSADPGFAVDAQAGFWIRVVSGAGAGQIKPIRRNSGTTFTVAGRFSPNVALNSVVEIVGSTVDITGSFFSLRTALNSDLSEIIPVIKFDGVDVGGTIVTNTSVVLEGGGRFTGPMQFEGGFLELHEMSMDLGGGGFPEGIRIRSGSVRTRTSGSAWLIRDSGNSGIGLFGSLGRFGASRAFLFRGALDDNVAAGIEMSTQCRLGTSTGLQGTGNGTFGIEADKACFIDLFLSDMLTLPDALTGTTDDLEIDGTAQSYIQIDAISDKVAIGAKNTVVDGST